MLGAMMIDNRIAEEIDKLTPEHFFEPLHGRIFGAIKKMVDAHMLATPVTLRPMFEADPAMKELGGPGYLARLTGSGAGLIGARQFAQQIYDLAMLRTLVGVGRELVDKAMDTSQEVNPRAQIEAAEEELFKVAGDGGSEASIKTFAQATTLAVEMAERALNSGGGVSGVTTGLTSINAKIGGIHRSDLIILAGRPGMGKTSLATNIAFNAAQRWMQDEQDGIDPKQRIGAKVAFFSLEMSADQLATRMLAEQSRISSQDLRMGKISQAEMDRLVVTAGELQNLPFVHRRYRRPHHRPAPHPHAAAAAAAGENGIGMVVVDYLQLLPGSGIARERQSRAGNFGDQPRVEDVGQGPERAGAGAVAAQPRGRKPRGQAAAIVATFANRDRSSRTPTSCCSSIARIITSRPRSPSDRPKATTPRCSRTMRNGRQEMERVYGLAELIVAKQRHGSTGKVMLKFEPRYTRFSDYAGDYSSPDYE